MTACVDFKLAQFFAAISAVHFWGFRFQKVLLLLANFCALIILNLFEKASVFTLLENLTSQGF